MKLLIAVLLLSLNLHASLEELRPFKTDYCTNYPEGTRSNPQMWKHCCLSHDMFFWAGGSKEDRYISDLELRSCIEKTGARSQARLIYYAVRLGSYSPVKYPDKKWGNGWSKRSEFKPLTSEELDVIENELSSGYDFISQEIKESFINKLRSRME
ncbi:MAG: hypothetical protein ACLGHN_07305 [Bacteriovoracia bacterium]